MSLAQIPHPHARVARGEPRQWPEIQRTAHRRRQGPRPPEQAETWSSLSPFRALLERPSEKPLQVSMGQPESARARRHPASFLFARYLRLWGQLWARGHAYQLTVKRRWKRLQSLLTEQGTASLTREPETGGEFAHQPSGIGQRRRASRRELSSNSVSQSPKSIQEWRTPALEDDRSRNVAERKGDARKAVV